MNKANVFHSAINAADRAIQHYKSTNGGALSQPVPILSAMPVGQDSVQHSSGLISSISALTKLSIDVNRVSSLNDTLIAYVLRFESHARIVYSSKLNLCWSRFYMCKEAAHLLMYNDENATKTVEQAVTLVKDLLNDPISSVDPQVEIENAAYYAAIEMLLPKELISVANEMKEVGCSNLAIAKSFLVPEKIVEYRLDSPHVELLFNNAYKI